MFDGINLKLEYSYLAWGIYKYYFDYIQRKNFCIEFCKDKFISEIEEEIKINKSLTNFDIYILNIEKNKNAKKISKENIDQHQLQKTKENALKLFDSNNVMIDYIIKTKDITKINNWMIEYKEYVSFVDKVNDLIENNNLKLQKTKYTYYYNNEIFYDSIFCNDDRNLFQIKKKFNKLKSYCDNRKNNPINSKYTIDNFMKKFNNLYGIYLLKSKGKIIYIGKAINLANRPLHSVKEREDKNSDFYPIDEICIYPTKTKSDMHVLEPYLISKYKPIFNIEFMEDENDRVTIFNCDITEKDFESNGIYE